MLKVASIAITFAEGDIVITFELNLEGKVSILWPPLLKVDPMDVTFSYHR